MDFVLFDDSFREQLFPFTHTRPLASLRVGILTIEEKWQYFFEGKSTMASVPYLNAVFNPSLTFASLFINGRILPDTNIAQEISNLQINEMLVANDVILAFRLTETPENFDFDAFDFSTFNRIEVQSTINIIEYPWHIFSKNDTAIQADFELLTQGKVSQILPEYVTAIHPENIFIEEGAVVNPCIINASNAKVYIGKEAEIMEGCLLRGNIALGEHAVLKMGAKVYSGTTIGPGCKVGGEVQNVVFYANSNKGHDGYLGNAVIGEWCNLGADTNCSNLKNDYGMVSIFSESKASYIDTGLQFCGLLMGDHSKCSINSMFNTGTVVGVSCNIFGTEFPPKFITSFTWGGSAASSSFRLDKAIDVANRMMNRRAKSLSEAEVVMFEYIYKRSHTS